MADEKAEKGPKFKIDVSGISPELLKQELTGKIVVTGRTLKDDAENPTWEYKDGYEAHLSLEGATIGDLITFSFSTSAWVRYQAKARKCTKAEIAGFLSTPLSLGELMTKGERVALNPVTAGMRAFDKMTPEEQIDYIKALQAKADAAKKAQVKPKATEAT